MQLHFVIYLRYNLQSIFSKGGMAGAIGFTIVLFFLCAYTSYTHIKICRTEPGYPERVSTATQELKMNFDKKRMSSNLKTLMTKRSKGFVGLLNNNN